MKYIRMLVVVLSLVIFTCVNGNAAEKEKTAEPMSDKDSVSYVIGTNMGRSLLNIKDEINQDMLLRGLQDNLKGKPMLIPEENMEAIMQGFAMKLQEKQAKEDQGVAKKNLEEGTKFLAKNSKKKGVKTTESGLQYMVINKGDGPIPAQTDTVEVNYVGTTIDGTEFDSSYKRGKPVEFPVKGVIKGWTEALSLMNVGSKYKLFIPSELAYGERRVSPIIGPSQVLIFEMELLGIKKNSIVQKKGER